MIQTIFANWVVFKTINIQFLIMVKKKPSITIQDVFFVMEIVMKIATYLKHLIQEITYFNFVVHLIILKKAMTKVRFARNANIIINIMSTKEIYIS